MAVQVTLLNRFVITLCDKDSQVALNNVFKNFSELPLQVMCEGINNIQWFIKHENKLISGAALNGLALGIMMAKMSEDPEQQAVFEGWLEQYSKINGDHVIDFQQHKAKRRL